MPAAIETRSPEAGSQNRLDPQISQNPRRAFADARYQRNPLDSIRTNSSWRIAVKAAKWPLVRRHIVQWQLTTGRSGPRTSYLTAPHRQPPVLMENEPSRTIISSSYFVRIPDENLKYQCLPRATLTASLPAQSRRRESATASTSIRNSSRIRRLTSTAASSCPHTRRAPRAPRTSGRYRFGL